MTQYEYHENILNFQDPIEFELSSVKVEEE